MNLYLAAVNTSGYQPQDDDRHVFTGPRDAWRYLADERQRAEDQTDTDDDRYSDTWRSLDYLASTDHRDGDPHEDWPTAPDGTGRIIGGTPGHEGSPYDLGEVYSVTVWAHADYPHEPGALYDCGPCEYTCHCDPDPDSVTETCVHCDLVSAGEHECQSNAGCALHG